MSESRKTIIVFKKVLMSFGDISPTNVRKVFTNISGLIIPKQAVVKYEVDYYNPFGRTSTYVDITVEFEDES